ncbi:MAG: radical SAM family heme chaperone HemW [Aphanocapsa feldmannii 277cV]|uniref:Heme chaperone HemW n=2 Tax=Aphanocapsa feldmannii TaxID=192050 RepID=A0A524RNJ0_9CHRO|nr:MAG: radical SAM family heme chaperone HemW [Aphanocapsa feldmannii 277cV]TGH24007.1 MAG: radical SAM family heme chaperone HemW [Aphanocapsa feldmannii 277cI]
MMQDLAPRSAYLHIPFCHRRCFYCDFAVVPLGDHAGGEGSGAIRAYLDWIRQEIDAVPAGPPLSTVYLGGGTPSMLSPQQVGSLLQTLGDRFGLAAAAEVTMELDPASFAEQQLTAYRQVGVNRVSLGAQSFDDGVLVRLGRRHRAAAVRQACGWLRRAGLRSWNLDLIAALPGQSMAHWSASLAAALAEAPPHLSVYELTIEPGTVFGRQLERGQLDLPGEDAALEMLLATHRTLVAAGYGHYEISSFALPGHVARHNRVYWSGANWWGFGMGATSAIGAVRVARPRTRMAYRRWLEQPLPAPLPPQPLERLEDLLIVGLRRREGVSLARLEALTGLMPGTLDGLGDALAWAVREALLCIEGRRLRLTAPLGFARSNQVLRSGLAWLEGVAPLPCKSPSPG